jgi:phenylacetic acid degradation protein
MLKVYAIDGIVPVVHPDAFVHPSAQLIGDVIVGPGVYVGPCACLRGDFGRIVIEEGANVQDCCILHAFPDRDLVVEVDGHVGHGAVLHGCVVKKNSMIGINSVINDNAVVGESSIIGAMAFVKAGFEVPPRSLVLGVPGKVVRELTDDELAWKREATRQYQELARRSLATMTETTALTEVEAKRKRFRDASVMPLSEMKKGNSE